MSCSHHWLYPITTGSTSHGKCKLCGAEIDSPSYIKRREFNSIFVKTSYIETIVNLIEAKDHRRFERKGRRVRS